MKKFSATGKAIEWKLEHKQKEITYDEIVDTTNFIIDSENIRNNMIANSGAIGTEQLQYDDPNNLPSKRAVKIRSGKLDKAEVHQEILKEQEAMKVQYEKAKSAQDTQRNTEAEAKQE